MLCGASLQQARGLRSSSSSAAIKRYHRRAPLPLWSRYAAASPLSDAPPKLSPFFLIPAAKQVSDGVVFAGGTGQPCQRSAPVARPRQRQHAARIPLGPLTKAFRSSLSASCTFDVRSLAVLIERCHRYRREQPIPRIFFHNGYGFSRLDGRAGVEWARE